ncbi:MAG: nucleoside deaminase [Terriglobales bacterium]
MGAVITRVTDGREVVIASAGNRVKTSGSSIKHVELETLKYVSSGYGRYLTEFVLYTTHELCAMCAGACVWARIGTVVYGVSQEDIAGFRRCIVGGAPDSKVFLNSSKRSLRFDMVTALLLSHLRWLNL